MTTTVYNVHYLINPETGRVFYVGKGSTPKWFKGLPPIAAPEDTPDAQADTHEDAPMPYHYGYMALERPHASRERSAVIRQLLAAGKNPIYKVVYTSNSSEDCLRVQRERIYAINQQYAAEGLPPLTNMSRGGNMYNRRGSNNEPTPTPTPAPAKLNVDLRFEQVDVVDDNDPRFEQDDTPDADSNSNSNINSNINSDSAGSLVSSDEFEIIARLRRAGMEAGSGPVKNSRSEFRKFWTKLDLPPEYLELKGFPDHLSDDIPKSLQPYLVYLVPDFYMLIDPIIPVDCRNELIRRYNEKGSRPYPLLTAYIGIVPIKDVHDFTMPGIVQTVAHVYQEAVNLTLTAPGGQSGRRGRTSQAGGQRSAERIQKDIAKQRRQQPRPLLQYNLVDPAGLDPPITPTSMLNPYAKQVQAVKGFPHKTTTTDKNKATDRIPVTSTATAALICKYNLFRYMAAEDVRTIRIRPEYMCIATDEHHAVNLQRIYSIYAKKVRTSFQKYTPNTTLAATESHLIHYPSGLL
jgi:hypothetical protein